MKHLPRILFIIVLLFIVNAEAVISINAQQQTERERGIELYKQNDFEEAVKLFRGAVKANKQDAEAWSYLGSALSHSGNQKEARKAFEQSLKINPNDINSRTNLVIVLVNLNKLKDAEKEAKKALSIFPQHAKAHYVMGIVLIRKQRNSQKGLDELETAVKMDPKYAKAWFSKSEAYLNLFAESSFENTNRFTYLNQSADALEEYLKLEPNDKDAALLRERLTALRLYSKRNQTKDNSQSDSEQKDIYGAKEVSTKAIITFKAQPEYTESARKNGVAGVVRVMAVLSADGQIKHILPVIGLPNGLTESAVRATGKIKFKPATINGHPVSQFVILEYNFRIY